MSLDLGVEFIKMALVKPGIPMETVLNRESQRKTPFALTIRNGERYFGDEALKKVVIVYKNLNFIFNFRQFLLQNKLFFSFWI